MPIKNFSERFFIGIEIFYSGGQYFILKSGIYIQTFILFYSFCPIKNKRMKNTFLILSITAGALLFSCGSEKGGGNGSSSTTGSSSSDSSKASDKSSKGNTGGTSTTSGSGSGGG